jgi:hypothetical protein
MAGTSGRGGTSWINSPGEMSSCMDLGRPLRPLNILDSLRRCDEVSLLASSEPRLFRLSSAPSPGLCRALPVSPRPSLLVTDVAEELMWLLDVVRCPGAASELSLLLGPTDGVVLRARSTAAIAWYCSRLNAQRLGQGECDCGLPCKHGGVYKRRGAASWIALLGGLWRRGRAACGVRWLQSFSQWIRQLVWMGGERPSARCGQKQV